MTADYKWQWIRNGIRGKVIFFYWLVLLWCWSYCCIYFSNILTVIINITHTPTLHNILSLRPAEIGLIGLLPHFLLLNCTAAARASVSDFWFGLILICAGLPYAVYDFFLIQKVFGPFFKLKRLATVFMKTLARVSPWQLIIQF